MPQKCNFFGRRSNDFFFLSLSSLLSFLSFPLLYLLSSSERREKIGLELFVKQMNNIFIISCSCNSNTQICIKNFFFPLSSHFSPSFPSIFFPFPFSKQFFHLENRLQEYFLIQEQRPTKKNSLGKINN